MRRQISVLLCLGVLSGLLGSVVQASNLQSVLSAPITISEGFEDDFIAGRSVPDLVDASLSSLFSAINEKRPAAIGMLTIRDRGIMQPGGVGGGFPPNNGSAFLDFTDGGGTYATFRFSPGCVVGSGSAVGFDVVTAGDDGSLFKFVSSDGVVFSQVGDGSDATGHHSFDLATGTSEAYFRLQVGNSAGQADGVHVDTIRATINCAPPDIAVDIKPGSDPNSIQCSGRNGVVPVAILTTDAFDATTVDHSTVTFEGAGPATVDRKTGEPRRKEEDVDGDGDVDLVFHFRFDETYLTCDSVQGTLRGQTFGGVPISGTDAVRMIARGGGSLFNRPIW